MTEYIWMHVLHHIINIFSPSKRSAVGSRSFKIGKSTPEDSITSMRNLRRSSASECRRPFPAAERVGEGRAFVHPAPRHHARPCKSTKKWKVGEKNERRRQACSSSQSSGKPSFRDSFFINWKNISKPTPCLSRFRIPGRKRPRQCSQTSQKDW